jgi:trigger factor
MNVSTEKLADGQVSLAIEVDPKQLEQFRQRAYKKLVQRFAIPGFRKGKAPMAIVERHLGKEVLQQEAIDLLVPEVTNEAIKEQGLDAIDVSDVEVDQEEPLILKATVSLRPVVDLGDYKSLRMERASVAVEEDEVDKELEALRQRYAVQEPVDRPVQWGDIVRADLKGTVDGRSVFNEEDTQFRLQEGQTLMVPGLAEKLIGLKKGDSSQFSIVLPEDFRRNLAGKECECTAAIHEIKEEKLPELNDGFAREVGEGFSDLKALRERVSENLTQDLEAEANTAFSNSIVEKLMETATMEYPEMLVDQEIDRLLQDQTSSSGQADVERYVEQLGKTADELRGELRPEAKRRVRRTLVLNKVAELEGIEITHEDIDEEIDRIAMSAGAQGEQIKMLFGSQAGHDAIGRTLLSRRTLDALIAVATGQAEADAKEVEALAAEAPPQAEVATAKRRTRRKSPETTEVGESS